MGVFFFPLNKCQNIAKCCTSSGTTKAVRKTDRNESTELSASHRNRPRDGSSALLKSCHQRQGQRLHCAENTSREQLFHNSSHTLPAQDAAQRESETDIRSATSLTMREGAPTHGLVQDGHQEHVAVFEIRLHLIDGLDPERERNNI